MRRALEALVRLAGLAVLGAGMALVVLVVLEVWNLYRMPAHVAVFAEQVEAASGVDRALNALVADKDPNTGSPQSMVHPSYYLSWVLVLLLLSLLTRVAFACIREGGRILLADLREVPVQPPVYGKYDESQAAAVSADAEPREPKTVIPRPLRPATVTRARSSARTSTGIADLRERSTS